MYANTVSLRSFRRSLQPPLSIPDPRSEWIAKFPRFRSENLADAQAHLRSLDDSIRLSVGNARGFRGYRASSHVALGSLALTVGSIDSADGYELAFQSRDEYIIHMPLRGNGRIFADGVSLELDHRHLVLITPCCRVVKHWRGPGHVVSLHMPKQALHRALRERGASIHSLNVNAVTVFSRQDMPAFLRLLNLVCDELAEVGRPLHETKTAGHCERLLISLLIDYLPRSDPHSQGRAISSVAPHYVRRAEDYIRANASESMTVKDIAAAAGVSSRALQYGFQRCRQMTPMLFIKRVRLERARALLRCPVGRPPRVGDVAARIGCYNISQFSRDYKAMFGETPSQTVASQRTLAGGGALLTPAHAAPAHAAPTPAVRNCT